MGPDPVDRDPRTGRVTYVTESGYGNDGSGCVRFSEDSGLTWSALIAEAFHQRGFDLFGMLLCGLKAAGIELVNWGLW